MGVWRWDEKGESDGQSVTGKGRENARVKGENRSQ